MIVTGRVIKIERNVPFNSRRARAFPVCRGLVWILFDWRITEIKARVAILERDETDFYVSVDALDQRMAALDESVISLHQSVGGLHETVDKLQRRVDYQSEWCQSLQEVIGVEPKVLKTQFYEKSEGSQS